MSDFIKRYKVLLLIFPITIYLFIKCSLFKVGILNNTNGAIAGCVYDSNIREGLGMANVIIIEPEDKVDKYSYGASTGENGKFLMIDIPSGYYDLSASVIGFHNLIIKNVKVAPDSITIVKFNMTPSILTVEVHPRMWTQTDSSLFLIKEFFYSGKIYEFKCKY